MNIDNLWMPPVLRRVRFFMDGEISEIFGLVFMNRASLCFRQQPVPSHQALKTWGFEVETLRHPKEAVLDLKAAGCPMFKYTVLWERPARPGEGEGPNKGSHRPAGDGRPEGPFQGRHMH